MIKVIDIESKPSTPIAEGRVRNILGPADDGTRVQVAIEEVDPGKTYRLAASDRTQVVYILEGKDAKVTYTTAGQKSERTAQRRAGVYLEPGEEADRHRIRNSADAAARHGAQAHRQAHGASDAGRLLLRRGTTPIAD